jgi:alpha,alpha-trehalase
VAVEEEVDPETGAKTLKGLPFVVPGGKFNELYGWVLEPYAQKHGVTFKEFVKGYNAGTIKEPELDEYFLHGRVVRESGHDTLYRLEKRCANLATIDLNSLLYKYERDISHAIRSKFNDKFPIPAEFCVGSMEPGQREISPVWDRRAKRRKAAIDKYFWNAEKGMYIDYDTVKQEQSDYESCTTFWAMWAGVSTPNQAVTVVEKRFQSSKQWGD